MRRRNIDAQTIMSPHASPPTDALDAAQAQSRFVAHMSHELRTPLAGLLSLLDLAHRLAQDPVQRRYLDVAMQSGRVLQRTIDMVLDLSRLRDGALPLADEPFDAAEAVAEVLRGALARIRATGLSMRYDWVGEPTWVRGDELRLRQIVANLVDNAVKFTTQGQVQVQGTLADAAGQTGRRLLTLTVDDTG
ncbi:MAG: ATP-binding protein, partial [Rubrivivax sp.]|nr:ATP-binding protein [Rubrivivax sp.]